FFLPMPSSYLASAVGSLSLILLLLLLLGRFPEQRLDPLLILVGRQGRTFGHELFQDDDDLTTGLLLGELLQSLVCLGQGLIVVAEEPEIHRVPGVGLHGGL